MTTDCGTETVLVFGFANAFRCDLHKSDDNKHCVNLFICQGSIFRAVAG